MRAYNLKFILFFLSSMFLSLFCDAQNLKGIVMDSISKAPLFSASIIEKGTTNGVTSQFDGKFELTLKNIPTTIVIKYLGYKAKELRITEANKTVKIELAPNTVLMKRVEIVDQRISDKQKESALTVEALDINAIKQTPAENFYDGLGQLKGVDLTSASIGFKVINTRGFNSTSPVRSLQLIDGVDNQAPGLNFSLGNFLGASELDVMKVDIIAGASSAFFGPNAFNGVISMKTKSPFIHQGLSAKIKGAERNMFQGAVRYAQAFKNKDGKEKFAYKFNLFYLRADDWQADNLSPIDGSVVPNGNWGGHDAVNRYGDEDLEGGNSFTDTLSLFSRPGLGTFYRTGYKETDLVDYNSENLKLGVALHYKIKPETELIVASNFGTGTTVYQGENRFSLKDILFFQNRIEIRKEDKFFIRAYATNEDAGNSYDAVFTAFRMQNLAKDTRTWNTDYSAYWNQVIKPQLRTLEGFPQLIFNKEHLRVADSVMKANSAQMQLWHDETRRNADQQTSNIDEAPFYEPGTARFDSLFNVVTSTKLNEGGSRFFDKSALYHVQGEYKFTPDFADITLGGNYRIYTPNSEGTIFSDTAGRTITNQEVGFYSGIEKKLLEEKLKLSATVRLDKNVNFKPLVSPAISAVYKLNDNHTFRLSFSSAIRNPTLADQYLYFNVGRAILLGNLDGFDSLVTIESFGNFLNTLDRDTLEYFNVSPIQPEKVRSLEVGYRGILFDKVYVDGSYYLSFYKDFIGYNLGIDLELSQFNLPTHLQAYRIAANATERVTTQGFSVGFNYFFAKGYAINGNYSWNKLTSEVNDPIIPAFNTPENKFNIGISGNEIPKHIGIWNLEDFGFNINYKWIQGFVFEGSPQFTGTIDSYGLLDAQVNQKIPKWNCTFKLGASNLLNNEVFQVYGGPRIGRLAYLSVLLDLKPKE